VPLVKPPVLSLWHSWKAAVVLALLILGFVFTPFPREVLTLAAAGVLLLSRKLASHKMLELVDWQLLVLFSGLFVVNYCLSHPIGGHANALTTIMDSIRSAGIDPAHPVWLFALAATLSNLVSNVPAVMLLMPDGYAPTHPQSGAILALASTLAGNLLIVSSIANIIVVDQARQHGVILTWKEHVRTGLPITLVTLAIAAGWLYVMSLMR
jgi:Na+/H+ antiporter NhaD/arsenite permease-like protein